MSLDVSGQQRFVAGRRLQGFDLVQIDGRSVTEAAGRLREAVAGRIGEDAARLFAEPLLRGGNGAAAARIDWYTGLEGEVSALLELDVARAEAIAAKARRLIDRIAPLLWDAEIGPLVSAALNVSGPHALLAVGDEPVLVDWGLLPLGIMGDEAKRRAHYESTLGTPLGLSLPLPAVSRESWMASYGSAPPSQSYVAGAFGPGRASVLPVGPPPRSPSRAGWIAPAVSALLLGLSFVPGVLRFPVEAPPEAGPASELARDILNGLATRRALLERASAFSCDRLANDLPALVPQPPGSVGILPSSPSSNKHATFDPAGVPPRAIGDPSTPGGGPASAGLSSQPAASAPEDLAERLTRATVLVIAGNATGSGFFVSDTLVVTNRHVVGGANRVLVAGQAVGLLEAQDVRIGPGGTLGDFALLRVPPQSAIRPLPLAPPGPPLLAVVSTGYPGLQLATDPVFRRLLSGEAGAVRELAPVFGTGVINHLQHPREGATLVLHGAEISPGNSGGPLTDYCGRVIGVNTFLRTDEKLPVTVRYALGTDGLLRFLATNGVSIETERGSCDLRGQARPAPAQPAVTPAPAADTPPTRPAR